MQIGIRMHDTRKLPLEERIRDISQLGFPCVHMAVSKIIDEFSTEDDALTPGFAMYLRKQLERNNIDVAVLGCYLNLATPNQEELERNIHRYLAHIRFASWLGVGVVGTETGCPNESYTCVPECRTEESLRLLIQNLKIIVEYAEKMGVVIGIEPVYRHIVCTPQRARRVLDEINSPNLQIILDPVNLLDMPNYSEQVAVVDEAVDLLGEDIAVIHLKDYLIEDGKMHFVGPGLGQMDYRNLFRYLKQKKPYIQATMEETTPENSLRCRQMMQNLFYNA